MRPRGVQNVRSSLATGFWLAALWLAPSVARAAQDVHPVDATKAYVERGHQTEARQKAYHERIDRFYQALSEAVRKSAPDLLAKLEPPPPDIYGYQIVPKLATDGPPSAPGTKSQVVSFSWNWSDTLIAREVKKLDQLESDLAQVPASAAGHASYEKLAADYRTLVGSRKSIDSDVQYNWSWQSQIAGNRPLFDHLKAVQDHVLEREALESAVASADEAQLRTAATKWGLNAIGTAESVRAGLSERIQAITQEMVTANGWAASRDFLRIEHPSPDQWLLTMPMYTDITDTAFLEGFRNAVETLWHVGGTNGGAEEFRVRVEIQPISAERLYCGSPDGARTTTANCAPPTKGDHIDVDAHVERFPSDAAVLSTGSSALRWVGKCGLALGPYEISPHVIAHEFGHVLGFPDAYYRGYRDGGADGFVVTELGDLSDIMGAPGTGPVLVRHFETLIRVKARDHLNLSLKLFQQQQYDESIAAAQEALALKPDYAEAYSNIAVAYAQQAKWDEAIGAAREALRLKPDFQLAKNNLAWAEAERAKIGTRQLGK